MPQPRDAAPDAVTGRTLRVLGLAAVIAVVPLAALGVVIALLVRGADNNTYTQIGVVLLVALATSLAQGLLVGPLSTGLAQGLPLG